MGNILRWQRQYSEAKSVLTHARALFDSIGDQPGSALCLRSLSKVLRAQHQYEDAKLVLEEARVIFGLMGRKSDVEGCIRAVEEIEAQQKRRRHFAVKIKS